MRALVLIENATNGNMREEHIFAIPPCCSVSKNPRPGSTLTVAYTPQGASLEVGSLLAFIHDFVGGLRAEKAEHGEGDGQLLVRDMEGMILTIAEHCSKALGLPVEVRANLKILPRQEMTLSVVQD